MATVVQTIEDSPSKEAQIIVELMARARAAMAVFAHADQARVDEAVTALAWAIYEPARCQELAELAVQDTGLGNVLSKITKNTRKTFGTLRDLSRAKTVGVIEEIPEKGLLKYAKPVGVVAAVTPSTNPSATPVNKAMMAIKGIYAEYGVNRLNHGIGFDTAAIELLLPTYAESLGLKQKLLEPDALHSLDRLLEEPSTRI